MSVRKRNWTTRTGEKRSAFIVDYTDSEGDRHVQTFKREKDAKTYHAKVAVNIAQGVHVAPSKSLTVREAAEVWIKRVEARGRERSTVRQYRQHVDLRINPCLGGVKLANLTTKTVETFRDDLLTKMTRPMARKVMTSLKSMLKVARMSHVMADVEGVAKPKREAKLQVGEDIPTNSEIKRLIAAAGEGRERALLLMLALTGLRASEARGLRWADIDLKASELHVRQRADRWNVIGQLKSDTSARSIPFSAELLIALKTWKLACPKGEHDLVFPTSTGAIEHHANMLRSLWSVMKTADVVDKKGEPKYALHAFRHWFASWCCNSKEKGGRQLPVNEVQKLLGHASPILTLSVYAHLFPETGDRKELSEATKALLAVDAT
jgi:integrase